MEIYKNWADVPENLKTKTQLLSLKLKPINVDDYAAKFHSRTYGDFLLYDIEKSKKIKERKIPDINDISITPDIIAEALYIINKSAKKSRNTKSLNYQRSKHSLVKRSKERENNLYEFKDEVLSKIQKMGWAKIIGYHKQQMLDDKIYLRLIQFNDFTFHQPIYQKDTDSLEFLGDIGIIPAEKTIKTSITFSQAVEILKKFLKEKPQLSTTVVNVKVKI